MAEKYDIVVVGAGAGGLTVALLLAGRGKRILVIEKSPRVGGALGGFEYDGYGLDAGFHFAGALQDGGIFDSLLRLLGLREMISPVFLDPGSANVFNFTSEGREIEFPYGMPEIIGRLREQFPSEGAAIERYFDTVRHVCDNTPSLKIETMHILPPTIEEDMVTLQDYLEGLTGDTLLKETLKAFVMCHGTAPSEISLANHARLCQGFYESVSMLSGGGSSLVNAMLSKLGSMDVEIATSEEIVGIADICGRRAGRLILKSGREIIPGNCVFTCPCGQTLSILPREAFPPAFFSRCEQFEDTPGFFTVFMDIGPKPVTSIARSIYSFYPEADINALSLPGREAPGALALVHSRSGDSNILTAFEPVFWNQVEQWKNSSFPDRPESYIRWKEAKTRAIMSRIFSRFPEYSSTAKLITSSSPLTYRDYLSHDCGAAYGVKQLIGQHNLFGQLRIRNLFVAGQSAVLPGVLGTIIASFLVSKDIQSYT
ncbi:MAG: NAD(P)/FAD-dependent oxidoreductase [Victivallales bacterium]|nr:NAD(P)/FAD-dependent oxidoreductase [Victivallales bacterium]